MIPSLIIATAIILALAAIAIWALRQAKWFAERCRVAQSCALDAQDIAFRAQDRVNELASERNEALKAAAHWQQIAGDNAEDAGKWRMSRAARIRRDANRTQAQRQPVLETMRQIQREMER